MKQPTSLGVYKVGGGVLNSPKELEKFMEYSNNMWQPQKEDERRMRLFVISAFGSMTNMIQSVINEALKLEGQDIILQNDANFLAAEEKLFDFFEQMQTMRTYIPPHVSDNFQSAIHSYVDSRMTPYDDALTLGIGEVYTSDIVVHEFNARKYNIGLEYARNIVKTSLENPLAAEVLLDKTQECFNEKIKNRLAFLKSNNEMTIITQGFVSSSHERNLPTLLGREGSDLSAAIFAKCAKDSNLFDNVSLTFIKSTPGIAIDFHESDEQQEFEKEMNWLLLEKMAARGSKIFHPEVPKLLKRSSIATMVTNLDYFATSDPTGKRCTIIS